MDEHDLTVFLVSEQNRLDHITKRLYGPNAKFEHLSAFGQNTVEHLSRARATISDPDPELKAAIARTRDLEYELELTTKKLAEALRENQDLWEENEEIKMKELDEGLPSRRTRSREERHSSDFEYE